MKLLELLYFAVAGLSAALPTTAHQISKRSDEHTILPSALRSHPVADGANAARTKYSHRLERRGPCYGRSCKSEQPPQGASLPFRQGSVRLNRPPHTSEQSHPTEASASEVNMSTSSRQAGHRSPRLTQSLLLQASRQQEQSSPRSGISGDQGAAAAPGPRIGLTAPRAKDLRRAESTTAAAGTSPESSPRSGSSQSPHHLSPSVRTFRQLGTADISSDRADFRDIMGDAKRLHDRYLSSASPPRPSGHQKRSFVPMLVRRGGCFGKGCPSLKIPSLRSKKAKEGMQPDSPTSSTTSRGSKITSSLKTGPTGNPAGPSRDSPLPLSPPRNSGMYSTFGSDLTLSIASHAPSQLQSRRSSAESAGASPTKSRSNPWTAAPRPTSGRRNAGEHTRPSLPGQSAPEVGNRYIMHPQPGSFTPSFPTAPDHGKPNPLISGNNLISKSGMGSSGSLFPMSGIMSTYGRDSSDSLALGSGLDSMRPSSERASTSLDRHPSPARAGITREQKPSTSAQQGPPSDGRPSTGSRPSSERADLYRSASASRLQTRPNAGLDSGGGLSAYGNGRGNGRGHGQGREGSNPTLQSASSTSSFGLWSEPEGPLIRATDVLDRESLGGSDL